MAVVWPRRRSAKPVRRIKVFSASRRRKREAPPRRRRWPPPPPRPARRRWGALRRARGRGRQKRPKRWGGRRRASWRGRRRCAASPMGAVAARAACGGRGAGGAAAGHRRGALAVGLPANREAGRRAAGWLCWRRRAEVAVAPAGRGGGARCRGGGGGVAARRPLVGAAAPSPPSGAAAVPGSAGGRGRRPPVGVPPGRGGAGPGGGIRLRAFIPNAPAEATVSSGTAAKVMSRGRVDGAAGGAPNPSRPCRHAPPPSRRPAALGHRSTEEARVAPRANGRPRGTVARRAVGPPGADGAGAGARRRRATGRRRDGDILDAPAATCRAWRRGLGGERRTGVLVQRETRSRTRCLTQTARPMPFLRSSWR